MPARCTRRSCRWYLRPKLSGECRPSPRLGNKIRRRRSAGLATVRQCIGLPAHHPSAVAVVTAGCEMPRLMLPNARHPRQSQLQVPHMVVTNLCTGIALMIDPESGLALRTIALSSERLQSKQYQLYELLFRHLAFQFLPYISNPNTPPELVLAGSLQSKQYTSHVERKKERTREKEIERQKQREKEREREIP